MKKNFNRRLSFFSLKFFVLPNAILKIGLKIRVTGSLSSTGLLATATGYPIALASIPTWARSEGGHATVMKGSAGAGIS